MTVVNEIREYREEHNLTQEDLAVETGVSRQTINAIETGKYNPSLELALRIARLFDVAVEDLFTLQPTDD